MAKHRVNRLAVEPVGETITVSTGGEIEPIEMPPIDENQEVFTTGLVTVVEESEEEKEPEPIPVIAVVINCDKLRVRRWPSEKDEVITLLNKGDEVELDLDDPVVEGWYKIILPNTNERGFCMKNYLQIKQ